MHFLNLGFLLVVLGTLQSSALGFATHRSESSAFATVRSRKAQAQYSGFASRLLQAINGDEDGSVDRAPCFDGACASDPGTLGDDVTESHQGEATTRLGVMTGPTVWSEFGRIGQEHPEAANLGQGFPDWLPPKFAVDSLVEAAMDSAKSPHQYTRTAGHPNLVKQLANRYSVHLKRDVDPMSQIAVTIGASQALYISLQTLIKPGAYESTFYFSNQYSGNDRFSCFVSLHSISHCFIYRR